MSVRQAAETNRWPMIPAVQFNRSRRSYQPNQVLLVAFVLVAATASPAWAKVLFLVHADGPTANADFALGSRTARPVVANAYKLAGTVDGGRFGRALNLNSNSANCTYDATGIKAIAGALGVNGALTEVLAFPELSRPAFLFSRSHSRVRS